MWFGLRHLFYEDKEGIGSTWEKYRVVVSEQQDVCIKCLLFLSPILSDIFNVAVRNWGINFYLCCRYQKKAAKLTQEFTASANEV